MPEFAPQYDVELVGRAWNVWVSKGRPSLIEPDFFERVLRSNDSQLAHLIWFDEMVEWIKTNRKYP